MDVTSAGLPCKQHNVSKKITRHLQKFVETLDTTSVKSPFSYTVSRYCCLDYAQSTPPIHQEVAILAVTYLLSLAIFQGAPSRFYKSHTTSQVCPHQRCISATHRSLLHPSPIYITHYFSISSLLYISTLHVSVLNKLHALTVEYMHRKRPTLFVSTVHTTVRSVSSRTQG